jgi:hypothetical protein
MTVQREAADDGDDDARSKGSVHRVHAPDRAWQPDATLARTAGLQAEPRYAPTVYIIPAHHLGRCAGMLAHSSGNMDQGKIDVPAIVRNPIPRPT